MIIFTPRVAPSIDGRLGKQTCSPLYHTSAPVRNKISSTHDPSQKHKAAHIFTTGPLHRLVDLVVKASAWRAVDAGFESRFQRDFFRVECHQRLENSKYSEMTTIFFFLTLVCRRILRSAADPMAKRSRWPLAGLSIEGSWV